MKRIVKNTMEESNSLSVYKKTSKNIADKAKANIR